MNFPSNLQYAKSHEWVLQEGDTYTLGISDFAQEELGDIVFVNLPQEGDAITMGEAFSDVESVKAVSDVLSPITGTVVAVNEELMDDPAKVNADPYGSWFVKVESVSDKEELLDAAAYEALCAAEKE